MKATLLGAAGFSLCRGAMAARPRAEPIAETPITEKIALITGAGGNVVVLTGADALLMVDGGLPERSAELLKRIQRLGGGRPVQVAFNTHWHWDHTGSNERLGKARTRIIAHENTRLWLGTEVYVEWEDRTYEPRPPHALPTETFYTSGELEFDGERVVYAHLPRAHTDGDIYVFFPDQNVLVAGGLLSVGRYPVLDWTTGGWIGGMVDATAALLARSDENTRIVPARGPVQTRAALEAQHQMLATLKDRLAGLMKKGMGPYDMIEARVTEDFDAEWGDSRQFLLNAYRGLWAHVRTLGGIV